MVEGRIQKLSHPEVKRLKVREDSVGIYRRGAFPRAETLRLFEIKDDSGDLLVRFGPGVGEKFQFFRMSGWTVVSYAYDRGFNWVER